MKNKAFQKLIQDMGNCNKCINFKCKNKSLINIYKDYDFCTSIPSIWTDWFNRLDSKIMIIGQDWGPYKEMQKLHELLNENKSDWQEVIKLEKSQTKKVLEKYIEESSKGMYSLNDVYITNAIMCARQGENYRGNTIDLKKSTINCSEYLLKQIEIVKPKVILTLGYYPLLSLATIFHFKIKDNIQNFSLIKIDNYIVIPLYHPVA